jgi:hypothetical protein
LGSVPQDGDIVVIREWKSAVRYAVRQLPGHVQLISSSPDEAVRLVRGFARTHAVDVWYSEGGSTRLLEAYRPGTVSLARVQGVEVEAV